VHDYHEIVVTEKVKNPSLSNSKGREKSIFDFTRVYEKERGALEFIKNADNNFTSSLGAFLNSSSYGPKNSIITNATICDLYLILFN
jgi:hypothetical protein